MKRSIQKIKTAHRKISRKIRAKDRTVAAHASVQRSISKWMDRSKDFVSTLPTLNELREEFADWHSFEPIHLDELAQA
jgi:hypothetical protein